jgi:diadenosine tetraphosphate (Ap4A) HIT family hydrolase
MRQCGMLLLYPQRHATEFLRTSPQAIAETYKFAYNAVRTLNSKVELSQAGRL